MLYHFLLGMPQTYFHSCRFVFLIRVILASSIGYNLFYLSDLSVFVQYILNNTDAVFTGSCIEFISCKDVSWTVIQSHRHFFSVNFTTLFRFPMWRWWLYKVKTFGTTHITEQIDIERLLSKNALIILKSTSITTLMV